ncbi:hypothetical protein KC338_g324 [Hortaea werneckii]|nr:hypothetical protein KC338_g324 [Hortaea werneckii]
MKATGELRQRESDCLFSMQYGVLGVSTISTDKRLMGDRRIEGYVADVVNAFLDLSCRILNLAVVTEARGAPIRERLVVQGH